MLGILTAYLLVHLEWRGQVSMPRGPVGVLALPRRAHTVALRVSQSDINFLSYHIDIDNIARNKMATRKILMLHGFV